MRGFQLMLEELLLRIKMWAGDPLPARSVAASLPSVPELVSPQRASELIAGHFGKSYSPSTIQNWAYAAKKQSPGGRVAWVEFAPDGKRGLKIKWPEFWSYYRSGALPPKQPRPTPT